MHGGEWGWIELHQREQFPHSFDSVNNFHNVEVAVQVRCQERRPQLRLDHGSGERLLFQVGREQHVPRRGKLEVDRIPGFLAAACIWVEHVHDGGIT